MATPEQHRPAGWVVGRVAGAPVVVTRSSLVAAVVLTLLYAGVFRGGVPGAPTLASAAVLVVLVFASVLAHELAHGLVARARGQQPHAFVLTLWGGHTTFGGAAATPGASALVAVAGPLTNLVLAVLLALAAAVVPAAGLAGALLETGARANAVLGLANLLPGLPLDGGRVVEAVVWRVTGDRHRGLVAAGRAGQAVVVALALVVVVPVWRSGGAPDLVTVAVAAAVGAFLWSGAAAAVRAGRTGRAVERLTLRAVGRPAVAVGAAATVADARAAAASAGVDEVAVVDGDGRPGAYVDREAAARVPEALAAATTVGAVCSPLPAGAVVDGTLEGEALLQALASATTHAPVVAALVDGRVVALVRTADVLAALRA